MQYHPSPLTLGYSFSLSTLTMGGRTAIETPILIRIARKDVPGAMRSAHMFHEKLKGVTTKAPVIPIRIVRRWSHTNLALASKASRLWHPRSPAPTNLKKNVSPTVTQSVKNKQYRA